MADYRRWFLPGGTYFFTIVTEGRVPLFVNSRAQASWQSFPWQSQIDTAPECGYIGAI
jgi:REP element-mobilizing transposase RayT